MRVGILVLHLHLPGCRSLKEKRHRMKPLLNRLRKAFNLSVAEVDAQDVWQTAVIACVTVSNDGRHAQHLLQKVTQWIEVNWPDVQITEDRVMLC